MFRNSVEKIISDLTANKRYQSLIFISITVLMTIVMMYCYSLYPGHDFYFHIRRFDILIKSLDEGNYPYYFDYTAFNNYGYITKLFYSDIILLPFAYIGTWIGTVKAYIVMIFFTTILCSFFTYISILKITKNTLIAFFSGILFTFSYYRLLDLYDRAALGEALSFTFIPLAFWGTIEIVKGNYKKWYILTIAYSCLIFTHLLSSFMMGIVTFIILIIKWKEIYKEPKRLVYLALAGAITLLIVSCYLFPMLEQITSNDFFYNTDSRRLTGLTNGEPIQHIIWGLFCGIVHPKHFTPGIGLIITGLIITRLFINNRKNKIYLLNNR